MFSHRFVFRVLALCLFFPLMSFADESGFEFEFNYGLGQDISQSVTAGPLASDLELENSRLLNASLFYRPGNHWAVGVEFASDSSELGSLAPLPVSGDVAVNTVTINGEYRFGGDRLRPFIGAGLGSMKLAGDAAAGVSSLDGDGSFLLAQVYGGVRYRVSDGISLQAQVRYRHADDAELRLGGALPILFDYQRVLFLVGANLQF